MFVTKDVCALVPSTQADRLAARLRRELGHEDVEIRRPARGRYALRDASLHETLVDAARGALAGGALGAVVGVVVATAVAGAGGAELVLIAFAGVVFGGLVGGVIGMQRHEAFDDDPCGDAEVADDQDLLLLRVHAEHARSWVYRLVEETPGARILEHTEPLPGPELGSSEVRR